jgi:hypothetical protein
MFQPNAGYQQPFDQLTSHVYVYNMNNPPVIPNVPVSHEFIPYLPMIATLIANGAGGLASTSPVRTYCFNNLAQNNWNNQSMATVVKMVCDVTMVKFQRGEINNVDGQILEMIVDNVLLLYASALAMNNGQLFGFLSPDMQQAVQSNYRAYNEMCAMTSQITPAGQLNQQFRQGQLAAPMAGMTHMGMGMQRQSAYPPANNLSASLGNSPTPRASQLIGSNRFKQGALTPKQTATAVRQPTGHIPGVPMTNQATQQPAETQASQPAEQKAIFTENIVLGEETMDRNLHRIAYHNLLFPNVLSPREEVKKSMKEAIVDFRMEEYEFETYTFSSLSTIISTILFENLESLGQGLAFKPSFIDVTNKVVSSVKCTAYLQKLKEVYTFGDMAKLLRSAAINVVPETAEARKKAIAWVAQVDKIMTAQVNYWLMMSFPSHTDRMDSFIEDAGELGSYISKNYGSAATVAYNQYQRHFLHTLATNLIPEDEEALQQAGGETNVITVKHAVFIANELAENLNYGISKKPVQIDIDTTPMLYKLVKEMLIKGEENKATRFMMVTADNTQFEFARAADDSTIFYIREA